MYTWLNPLWWNVHQKNDLNKINSLKSLLIIIQKGDKLVWKEQRSANIQQTFILHLFGYAPPPPPQFLHAHFDFEIDYIVSTQNLRDINNVAALYTRGP